MGKQKAVVREVRREIEPELLSKKEQAEWSARRGLLRADIRHIQGHATALGHLAQCGNEFLREDLIDAELVKLLEVVSQALARREAARLCA